MRIGRSSIPPVLPGDASRRAKPRNGGSQNERPLASGTAIVPYSGAESSTSTLQHGKTSNQTLVAAQVLAQKMPSLSDRRLARHFPETAIAAYRQSADRKDAGARILRRRSA